MTDPGLPPKHRSLNLLESLVKEEEEKAAQRSRGSLEVDIPYDRSPSARSLSEFYDTEKQQINKENSLTSSFTEYKMKDSDIGSKVKRGDPNAGFQGKKVKKQRPGSASPDKTSQSPKHSRPYSADYNKYSRKDMNNKSVGRPSTAKNRSNRTSSPKGVRRRSRGYSSDSYSSDDTISKKNDSDFHDFFDSGSDRERDKGKTPVQRKSRDKKGRKKNDSRSDSEDRKGHKSDSSSESGDRMKQRRTSSSDSLSSSSSDEERDKRYTNGHGSARRNITREVKTVYVSRNGHQRTSESDGENNQRKVVVEDYSSISASEEEDSKKIEHPSTSSKPPKGLKPTKRLLSRKKHQNCTRIYQINPDTYLEGKLHQKYSELEELLACSFVDQRSHVTRHHLYQMELLRDQYKAASHGLMSSATIIPRSLPEDVRKKTHRPYSAGPRRPNSGKRSGHSRRRNSDQESGKSIYT